MQSSTMRHLTLYRLSLLLLIYTQFSCSSGTDRVESIEEVPQFIVTDSLVVDYLGVLTILDIKADRSEYLMYDPQRKEFLRVNEHGDIMLSKNLSADGKDSFGVYFYSAHYYADDKLLIFPYSGGIYTYDFQFNLLSKETPFNIFTNALGSGIATLLVDNKLFANKYPEKASVDLYAHEDYLARHPFLTTYDLDKKKVIAEQYLPKESQIIQHPGKYSEPAPHSIMMEDELYLLFSNSPEIYKYSFPELKLLGKVALNPSDKYVQVKPFPVEALGNGVFNKLAGSEYFHFSSSNGYLLTGYLGAAPQDKVDALPQDLLGGEDFMALVKEYKIPYYQIRKGGKILWEGQNDTRFKFKGGHLFADRNIIQPKVEEEKDHVVYYFYEIG
ncbi:hypothetical protein CA2015_0695 [Cyclobacterium amurskyense]|uniref:Uncharacterized protein n=2 Tax=Cyclobacterium amurskyense TaxID=320787 RepID=A0A0H4PBI8_9BACT|nr:hypothetical protein CA2015_0695 [Cyclobacterium amurskyense]